MLKSLVITCVALAFSFTLFAQSSDELKKKQAEIQQEINDLRKTLDATKKNKKASIGQLALVQKKIRLREQAINNINDQINVIQFNINQSRGEISKLKRELDTLKLLYEKSVVYAYKNRSNYDFLNFIFAASNFNDALKRVQYLKSYRNYREQQAVTIVNTQSLLQNKISNLELSRKQKDEVLHKQEKEKQVLVVERREKDDVVSKLKAREKEINKELSDKSKADAKLKRAIKVAIDREIAAARAKAAEEAKKNKTVTTAPKSTSSTAKKDEAAKKPKSDFEATPEGALISADFEKNKGRFSWPIDKGNIRIHYGPYKIEGTEIIGNNPGLTMEGVASGAVKCIFEGEVSRVFDIEGNWSVLVRHGKYFTVYSNLASVSVSKNDKVSTGQMLGRAANNNDGNGEIEFLLMQENKNLNPEPWLKRK